MSTLIPLTPAANKTADQHQEPSEQDSFNHLLYKVLRLTSEQVQDLNGWLEHRGFPNVHEHIAQNFHKPHALEDNLKFISQGKTCYIQSNVMFSLSLMITYIRHRRYSTKSKYFGPFYYIQIDPQDYDEWRTAPPDEEIHFSGPNEEDEHQNLSSDDNQVIQQENVGSEPPEPLSYSLFQSHFQGSSTSNTQKILLPKPIWEKPSKDQQQMIIDHNRSLPKSGSPHLSTPNKSPSPLPHKPTPQQTAKSQQEHTHQSDESTTDTIKTETTPSILSLFSSRMVWPMPPPLEDPQIRTWTHIHMSSSHLLMKATPVKSLTTLLVTPCLMLMVISMSPSLPTSTPSWMHLQEIVGHTQKSLLFSQPISIRVHHKSLTGIHNAHFLHVHPHPASRTLSMSPPGMELLQTPRITLKSTLSLAILFSASPDAVKLLQQTPSSLTPLLLMMVQPWPNSSVVMILLSVMHMASNQPNNSSTPSLITSEIGEPWIPSSVMEANMTSPRESLISSIPYSSNIISLNLITNTKIRLKIALDLPSVTPTLS